MTAIEAVRKRPGMYFGEMEDGSICINLILEVINFFLQESHKSSCDSISIVIHENHEIQISAYGLSLPSDKVEGHWYMEKLMTELNVTKNLLAGVNALSSTASIQTTQAGYLCCQNYHEAVAEPLQKIKQSDEIFTCIRFLPNIEYIPQIFINRSLLSERLQDLCYFNRGISIECEDKSIRKMSFQGANGLSDYIEPLYAKKFGVDEKSAEIFNFTDCLKGIKVSVSCGFEPIYDKNISYVNGEKSIKGGTHVDGFIAGMAQAVKALSGCKLNASIWKRFILEGVLLAMNVNLDEPQFSGSTKDKLVSREVFVTTKKVVYKHMLAYLQDNRLLCQKLLKTYIGRFIQYRYQQKYRGDICTSADFVETLINNSFIDPSQFINIVQDYQELERCLVKCQKIQDQLKD